MSWPALRTAGSARTARSGSSAALESGGRVGGGGGKNSPSRARGANGRDQERPRAPAMASPASPGSARNATSGAFRTSATSAAICAGSSTMRGSASWGARTAAAGADSPAVAAGVAVPTLSSASSLGISVRNSSSVNNVTSVCVSGRCTRSCSRSSVTGASRRSVTRRRQGRAPPQRDELTRETRVVRLRQQRFARAFPGNLGGLCQNRVEVAVGLEQLDRGLVADTLDPGDVVGAVADQSEIIDDALGRHAEPLVGVALIDPLLLDRDRK